MTFTVESRVEEVWVDVRPFQQAMQQDGGFLVGVLWAVDAMFGQGAGEDAQTG